MTGAKLGSYSTGTMPPNAEVVRSTDEIEARMGFAPNARQGQYNIRLDASFAGTLAYRKATADRDEGSLSATALNRDSLEGIDDECCKGRAISRS